MTEAQRARRIRQHHTRLAAIDAEARQIKAALLPLEAEESWSMGFKVVLRGPQLAAAMARRDAKGVQAA